MNDKLNGMVDLAGPAYSKLFRGLFDGTLVQVVNEILQNAQRAGATRVSFRHDPATNQTHVEDNGSGLVSCGRTLPDDSDMIALLMTTRTAHSAAVIAEQSPMGLGFLSVLAHEHTRSVEVASGYAGLTIDTERWWSDYTYRDQTRERITWYRERIDGFQMAITGWNPTALEKALRKLVDGYRDLLDITLDGFSVKPEVTHRPFDLHIIDTGRTLVTLQPNSSGSSSYSTCVINFWGQVIEANWTLPWRGYVHIREAAPFDFITPVRTGVIRNERWDLWVRSIREAILTRFSGSVSPERRAELTPEIFSALEQMENGWGARNGCAVWRIAARNRAGRNYISHLEEERRIVVWASDLPSHAILVDRDVRLEELDEHGHPIDDMIIEKLAKECMANLAEDLAITPYYHEAGAFMPAHLIVWAAPRVQVPRVNSDFFGLGTWYLETPDGDRSQTFDMSGEVVFTAEDNRGDWSDGYGIIAMLENPTDVITILEAAAAWIAEEQDNRTSWDGEGEEARSRFWREVAITIAKLRGTELPKNWTWDVLEDVAGKTAVKVEKHAIKQDMYRSWVRVMEWKVTFEDGTEKIYTE